MVRAAVPGLSDGLSADARTPRKQHPPPFLQSRAGCVLIGAVPTPLDKLPDGVANVFACFVALLGGLLLAAAIIVGGLWFLASFNGH